MKQLSLFPNIVKSAHLLAVNSSRSTFYKIWIEENAGFYSVIKESGSRGNVLDRRKWPADNLSHAEKLFESRVKSKTNPNRKSPRTYMIADEPNSKK